MEINKMRRICLTALLALCVGTILVGGMEYIASLRGDLMDQTIQNVLTVTEQQQQAIDNFISGDRERLHSFAEYFSRYQYQNPEEVQRQLTLFNDVDAVYSVACLDEGWFCTNTSTQIRQLDRETLDNYRAFEGSGVRNTFIDSFVGLPRFGYYETFTFPSGHQGIIQKSYDRTKVTNTFSLSFYNDRGLAYVVDRNGEILIHSNGMLGDRLYDNIADVVAENHTEDVSDFLKFLQYGESGSETIYGSKGGFVYSYVPMKSVPSWYLVSIVSVDAISSEADHILLNSQRAVAVLLLVLLASAVFILLIWRTYQNMRLKDQQIEYQEQVFDIFAAHLSENTNDVYMLMDLPLSTVEYVSPNAERVLGIPEESVSADLRAIITASDLEGGAHLDIDEIYGLKPGQSVKPITAVYVNPRSKERQWFNVNIYCTEIQGRPKTVVYVSDRTLEHETQEHLSEALSLAEVANEAKSTFLSSVSHDIRTPMNAIIGLVTLLKDEADNPEVVLEYTQRIDAASQHLLGLINDVLDVNKIESGSATLNVADMNLAEIIDEINTIIRPQANAKKQRFDIFVSSLVYEHLRGDKLRINQILINLLSNAVKYTPAGGEIEMRVEELPQVVDEYSRVRFTVRDNGMGMSEEYLKVIFDPFTREETAATRQIQGTGLGMAITKRLVDLMGGSIQVESQLGKGSTFTVELELYIQEQKHDPEFWKQHKVVRMIVADDEEEVCLNIVRAMEKTGVQTDYSTSGENAVAMMRENREAGRPYDLILLDWKMPGLNGLETARLIRKNYPEKIPILLLTAYDWGEIEQEAKEIGVNHFMPKPFFMSTFQDAIRRVMGNDKKTETAEDSVLKGKHILVVDDIEVNRIILVKILNSLGAECGTASNGQEAVDQFEASGPGTCDLILMDVQMPEMDGYTATKTIRAGSHPEAKTVPIIAMTANAFVDDVRDAIASGMDAHIAKPVQVDKLKATIRQVLDSRPESSNSENTDHS